MILHIDEGIIHVSKHPPIIYFLINFFLKQPADFWVPQPAPFRLLTEDVKTKLLICAWYLYNLQVLLQTVLHCVQVHMCR